MNKLSTSLRNWMRNDTMAGSVSKRRRFTPVAVATGALAVALLAGTASGTLSGFTASITNPTNTAGSGVLTMSEATTGTTPVTCNSTDGGSINTNTATCAGINKLGGNLAMVPGQAVVTTVIIKNTGTVTASTFTLLPGGACVSSNNGAVNGSALAAFCGNVNVVITNGATTVFSGTAASLGTATAASFTLPATVAPGVSTTFVFTTTLASGVTNTSQGLQASVPLVWTFNA